jgi:hypothetical protein
MAGVFLLTVSAFAIQQGASSDMQRAVEEFRVQTRNLGLRPDSPRKSRRRGKSGIKSYHGRIFWNIRNDAFDAVPHEVTQTGGDKGILRRNQYGFNVSGPVSIPKLYDGSNRTFFSLSYEGMRETIGRQYLQTIPIVPERSGNFSRTLDKSGDLLPIFDPATTSDNPNFDPSHPVSTSNLQYLRDPFPGNVIPSDRLDQVAMDALKHYPQPNVAIGPYDQNNYSIYSPERNEADGMRGKVDHTINDKNRASVSFAFTNGFAGPASFFETIANPGRPDRDSSSRSLSGTHTYTLSPTSINTFRIFGWTSKSENLSAEDATGEIFPSFRMSPYLSMGRSYPVSRTNRAQYGLSDGISTRLGAHSLRFAGALNFQRVHSFWPQYPSGRFNFDSGLTQLPGIVNTGHTFSSFALGLSSFAEGSIVEHPSYFRQWDVELQVRDEWEVMTTMTLSLGVFLNVNPGRTEKYNRQSTIDFNVINPENGQPGALVFAGRDGQPSAFQRTFYPVEPWAAITWSPFDDSKTVVRASYRRRYRSFPLYSGQWGTQGFNGTPTFITSNSQLEPAVVLEDGLPDLPNDIPDLRPGAANDTIADHRDRTDKIATYDYARLSIERQLPHEFTLTLGASVTRGKNMLTDEDGANPNAIPLDDLQFRDLLNEEEFNKSRRPFPQYQGFDLSNLYPAGRYDRTAGSVEVEKKTSQGLSLRMSYEYSKQMDDYSSNGLQDYNNRDNEWALNPYNDPHRASLSYMYELPFGPSRQLLNYTDWRRHALEGWAISGMTTYSSGDPISLRAEFNNTGNVIETLYVNQVPGVNAVFEQQTPELWFNPAAFINPPDFATGNVARTHPGLRNPIRQNHDLSVTKRFTITSERALEFMGTAFNFINHANWNRPDADIGTEDSPNSNAGKIIGSRGGRVIQLGLRLTF